MLFPQGIFWPLSGVLDRFLLVIKNNAVFNEVTPVV